MLWAICASLSSDRHDFLALRDGLRRKRGTARSQCDKNLSQVKFNLRLVTLVYICSHWPLCAEEIYPREKEKVNSYQLNYIQPFYGVYTCREQESTDALQMKPVWVHFISTENLIIKCFEVTSLLSELQWIKFTVQFANWCLDLIRHNISFPIFFSFRSVGGPDCWRMLCNLSVNCDPPDTTRYDGKNTVVKRLACVRRSILIGCAPIFQFPSQNFKGKYNKKPVSQNKRKKKEICF